jgi:hypothetical protein
MFTTRQLATKASAIVVAGLLLLGTSLSATAGKKDANNARTLAKYSPDQAKHLEKKISKENPDKSQKQIAKMVREAAPKNLGHASRSSGSGQSSSTTKKLTKNKKK